MAKSREYFVVLPEPLLNSPAYRDLKPPTRALLTEFLRKYRPSRNGRLTIDSVTARQLINSSEKVTDRAFYELSEHGFIKLIKCQSWTKNEGREWALTFHKLNDYEPTNEYLNWTKGMNMQPDLNRPKWLR